MTVVRSVSAPARDLARSLPAGPHPPARGLLLLGILTAIGGLAPILAPIAGKPGRGTAAPRPTAAGRPRPHHARPAGGAILRRPACGGTLRQVYDALETQPVIALHQGPNPACPVGRHIGEVLAGVTAAAEEAVHAELAAITLEEIVRRTDRKRREPKRVS